MTNTGNPHEVRYTLRDLESVLDKYIQHHEGAGLSRKDARLLALTDVTSRLDIRLELVRSGHIIADTQITQILQLEQRPKASPSQ